MDWELDFATDVRVLDRDTTLGRALREGSTPAGHSMGVSCFDPGQPVVKNAPERPPLKSLLPVETGGQPIHPLALPRPSLERVRQVILQGSRRSHGSRYKSYCCRSCHSTSSIGTPSSTLAVIEGRGDGQSGRDMHSCPPLGLRTACMILPLVHALFLSRQHEMEVNDSLTRETGSLSGA